MRQEPDIPQDESYYCVEANLPSTFRELFVETLWSLETVGLEEFEEGNGHRILAYFEGNQSLPVLRSSIEASLKAMACSQGTLRFHRLRFDSQAWLDRYSSTFMGFAVNPTFWVYPPWDAPSPAHPVNIRLEPGHGFGTGTHESTQLALEAIESCVGRCASMLDFGTGSGLLAVAGARLQPSLRIAAFDIDLLASEAAARTFRLNALNSISLFCGESFVLKGQYDLVVANLTAPILQKVAVELNRLTSRHLVVSGFTESDVVPVTESIQQSGPFRENERWARNEWICMLFDRCEE